MEKCHIAFSFLLLLHTLLVVQGFLFNSKDLTDEKSLWDLYTRWASFHKISRTKAETAKRFNVFVDNVRFIDAFNKKGQSFTVELNAFGDLTNTEFLSLYTGIKPTVHAAAPNGTANLTLIAPTSIDWRNLGAVTGVKDQGSCGSCWAFSTVVGVEGYHKIKTGTLVSLSEQVFVDCDTWDNGCQGGNLDNAYYFVLSNGGIPSEANYPYLGYTSSCDAVKLNEIAASITGYLDVTPNNENALKQAVATNPVTVAIDAGGYAFQFYKSGIFTGTCGTSLNHGVAIVGYGTNYWIVKNSWGTSWGNAGYILMARGMNRPYGLCGINMWPVYPI